MTSLVSLAPKIGAAVLGCAALGGVLWTVLHTEPTRSSVELQAIATDRTSGTSNYSLKNRTQETVLVPVAPMAALAARPTGATDVPSMESAREALEPAEKASGLCGPVTVNLTLPSGHASGSDAFRLVLSKPEPRSVDNGQDRTYSASAMEPSVLIDDLPLATSYQLELYVADDLYAVTRVPMSGASATTLELDFVANGKHETAAIATLRSIAKAQQMLQASAAIDTDANGAGEFGYLAELAGTRPIRCFAAAGPWVDPNGPLLDPTYLPKAMGELKATNSGGVMVRGGYSFLMFLPGASDSQPFAGIPEAREGGSPAIIPGSSSAETLWCCYAWPTEASLPGGRVFMINQAGDVIAAKNASAPYVGTDSIPRFDAAYSVPGDMGSKLGLAALGLVPNDQQVWSPAGQ